MAQQAPPESGAAEQGGDGELLQVRVPTMSWPLVATPVPEAGDVVPDSAMTAQTSPSETSARWGR